MGLNTDIKSLLGVSGSGYFSGLSRDDKTSLYSSLQGKTAPTVDGNAKLDAAISNYLGPASQGHSGGIPSQNLTPAQIQSIVDSKKSNDSPMIGSTLGQINDAYTGGDTSNYNNYTFQTPSTMGQLYVNNYSNPQNFGQSLDSYVKNSSAYTGLNDLYTKLKGDYSDLETKYKGLQGTQGVNGTSQGISTLYPRVNWGNYQTANRGSRYFNPSSGQYNLDNTVTMGV